MAFWIIIVPAFMIAGATDCSVGGSSLCSCSELIQKHVIHSSDECTQSAVEDACKSSMCVHHMGMRGASVRAANASIIEKTKLPYSYRNEVGPFIMTWGFPSADTIEIEFSLPSDYYIGIGWTEDGVGDAVAGWVDDHGQVFVGDYWDAGSRQPDTDESKSCQNDIEPISGDYAAGVTTVRFRRKLQTGDKSGCDEPISKGPMSINYAWCDAPWCFDYQSGCKAYEPGCLDSPHSSDAANHVTIDFSGSMLETDIVL